MSVALGLTSKVYKNTGTYGSPTWVDQTWVREHSVDLSKGEADATSRANGGWKATVATLKDGAIEVVGVHDNANTNYVAFVTAWHSDTVLDLVLCDGDITTVGTRGIRASFQIFNMSEPAPLEEVLVTTFSLKPTHSANAPAAWHTAS